SVRPARYAACVIEERNSSGAQTHSIPASSASFVSASRSAIEVPIAATEMRSKALMLRRRSGGDGLANLSENGVGDPVAVPSGVAEHRGVRLSPLEEKV